jgi:hypothetical protein
MRDGVSHFTADRWRSVEHQRCVGNVIARHCCTDHNELLGLVMTTVPGIDEQLFMVPNIMTMAEIITRKTGDRRLRHVQGQVLAAPRARATGCCCSLLLTLA